MKIHSDVVQGTADWLALRNNHLCASDASAAMGVSKYKSRSTLLREKFTGVTDDVDPAKQRLFDAGHAAENAARSLVENTLSEELFPCTVTADIDGLPLLASLDGLTMVGDIIWESKLFNADLAAAVDAGELDTHYWAQLEHQLLVTGAEKAYFTTSDGTPERTKGMWYTSVPERRTQVLSAWKQFAEDLANYQHVEVIPAAVAAPIDELPALTVQLVGEVKATNLVTWKASVVARIQAINIDLKTDADFATAKKTVSFLEDGEKKLTMVKSQALAQTASIDELFRTIDSLQAEMRSKRLSLDKLVVAREKSIKEEIVAGGKAAFDEHIAGLNKRLGKDYMPIVPADFAGAIKNKRTIASLKDAVDTELSRAKIAANAIADGIQINLNTLTELASDHKHLFADAAQIVLKQNDDLTVLVKSRIAEFKLAEEKRLEAERNRIRQEEEAKANAKAQQAIAAATPTAPAGQPVSNQPAVASAALSTPAPKPKLVSSPTGPRPTDADILKVLAGHYKVSESKALQWICDLDVDAALERLADQEAA